MRLQAYRRLCGSFALVKLSIHYNTYEHDHTVQCIFVLEEVVLPAHLFHCVFDLHLSPVSRLSLLQQDTHSRQSSPNTFSPFFIIVSDYR
jgi:hypothetical protein